MISPVHSRRCPVPLALAWSDAGVRRRLTAWPEAQVERAYGAEWVPCAPSPGVLRSVANRVPAGAWRGYLEFLPADAREFVGCFRINRLLAVQVAARCPELVGTLTETPALTAFVAAHPALRGTPTTRWHEVNAIYERGGVFGLLEWLGLPAARQTLSILANLVAPDLAPHLLEPLRALLWRPQGVFALARLPAITDQDLSDACALAA